MVQATTPTFTLTLPNTIDLSEAEHIVFSLEQDFVSVHKDESDMTINENVVTVSLNQDDTVSLSKGFAKIQLNWTYDDGTRAATKVKTVDVSENLFRDVIE